jgi:hypothetical protein
MSRRDALEQHIRRSYGLIRDYERIFRTTDRPREKLRTVHVLQEQWTLVDGYLA